MLYDRDAQDSWEVVAQVVAATGRIEVPPSAHLHILAGTGKVALELLEDAGGPRDTVLVPCSGG